MPPKSFKDKSIQFRPTSIRLDRSLARVNIPLQSWLKPLLPTTLRCISDVADLTSTEDLYNFNCLIQLFTFVSTLPQAPSKAPLKLVNSSVKSSSRSLMVAESSPPAATASSMASRHFPIATNSPRMPMSSPRRQANWVLSSALSPRPSDEPPTLLPAVCRALLRGHCSPPVDTASDSSSDVPTFLQLFFSCRLCTFWVGCPSGSQ